MTLDDLYYFFAFIGILVLLCKLYAALDELSAPKPPLSGY